MLHNPTRKVTLLGGLIGGTLRGALATTHTATLLKRKA